MCVAEMWLVSRSADVELCMQIMLCTTLNPFIATGALLIPSSIYAILKVRSLGRSPSVLYHVLSSQALFFWLVQQVLCDVVSEILRAYLFEALRFLWTEGFGNRISCLLTQTFVFKPYNSRRNRRKSLELRRATYAQVSFFPDISQISFVGDPLCNRMTGLRSRCVLALFFRQSS